MKRAFFLMLLLQLAGVIAKAQHRLELSLEALWAMADSSSQQIRVSTRGCEVSGEGLLAAKSQRLPDVNLRLGGSYIGTASVLSRGFSRSGSTEVPYAMGVGQVHNGAQPTPHWGNEFVFQVSQVIYAGGGIAASIRLSEQGVQMAHLDLEKNRQEVRFLLVGLFLDLSKQYNLLEALRKNIQLTEQLLRNIKSRYEQGAALRNDITRYELQLETLRLKETQMSNAMSIIEHQIVTTLHLPEDTHIKPCLTWESAGCAELDTWQQHASSDNVTLKQARLATDMGRTEVKAVRAGLLPHIAVVAEDRLAGPYVNDLIPVDANINAWYVGVGIRYNLGSLWRRNHDLKKSRLSVRQREDQEVLARENVSHAVQAEYVSMQTAKAEVETHKKQVVLAAEHYEVTQNRYENGLALLTDMLDASHERLSADMQYVNAQIALLYNYYKLKYLTSSL